MNKPHIIGGDFKGRALDVPKNVTRPTMGRVRQTLFDKLTHGQCRDEFPLGGNTVMDVFAGSGAFGLEALSRGAKAAYFFDKDRMGVRVLRRNITRCRVGGRVNIACGDVTAPSLPLGHGDVGIGFIDPPYGENLIVPALRNLFEKKYFTSHPLILCETSLREDFFDDVMRIEVEKGGKGTFVLACFDNIMTKRTRLSFWHLAG